MIWMNKQKRHWKTALAVKLALFLLTPSLLFFAMPSVSPSVAANYLPITIYVGSG